MFDIFSFRALPEGRLFEVLLKHSKRKYIESEIMNRLVVPTNQKNVLVVVDCKYEVQEMVDARGSA